MAAPLQTQTSNDFSGTSSLTQTVSITLAAGTTVVVFVGGGNSTGLAAAVTDTLVGEPVYTALDSVDPNTGGFYLETSYIMVSGVAARRRNSNVDQPCGFPYACCRRMAGGKHARRTRGSPSI